MSHLDTGESPRLPKAPEAGARQPRAATGIRVAGLALCVVLSLALCPARAADGPDAEMMTPVTALANFMAHSQGATRPPVFVDDGAVIVENFFPYLFRGAGAADRWGAIFQQHAVEHRLRDLVYTFGKAQDFDRTGDRAYFVLPTRWTGSYQRGDGPRGTFDENGAWTFVLLKLADGWRISAYAWGVTGTNGA